MPDFVALRIKITRDAARADLKQPPVRHANLVFSPEILALGAEGVLDGDGCATDDGVEHGGRVVVDRRRWLVTPVGLLKVVDRLLPMRDAGTEAVRSDLATDALPLLQRAPPRRRAAQCLGGNLQQDRVDAPVELPVGDVHRQARAQAPGDQAGVQGVSNSARGFLMNRHGNLPARSSSIPGPALAKAR